MQAVVLVDHSFYCPFRRPSGEPVEEDAAQAQQGSDPISHLEPDQEHTRSRNGLYSALEEEDNVWGK